MKIILFAFLIAFIIPMILFIILLAVLTSIIGKEMALVISSIVLSVGGLKFASSRESGFIWFAILFAIFVAWAMTLKDVFGIDILGPLNELEAAIFKTES